MSGRGSVATKGYIDTKEYDTVELVYDAKVLKGTSKQYHSLPDYSHSAEAIYIKYEEDGSFREMRFYNAKHEAVIEIAYHPEPKLSPSGKDRKTPILHYHLLTPSLNFKRDDPVLLKKDSLYYKMAEKYLRRFGL